MKDFISNYSFYLFVLLVLAGWFIVGLTGNYFLVVFYFLYVALFLGLLNMVKYSSLELFNVNDDEIRRQIKHQSMITFVLTITFFLLKLHTYFTIEILIIFIIVLILSLCDLVLKMVELKRRNVNNQNK